VEGGRDERRRSGQGVAVDLKCSGGWEDVDIRRGAWSAGLFNHCRLGVNRLFGTDYLSRNAAGGLADATVSRISEHASLL
jgi:hypothetical protein